MSRKKQLKAAKVITSKKQLKAASVASGLGLNDPRLLTFYAGGPTVAGEMISPQSAMQIDTVYACVKLISQTISTLPLDVRQRLGSDEKAVGKLAKDHRLYSVLHDRPNHDMTAVTFLTSMFACVLLWGNAYALIDRRYDGSVISLTPLMPMFLTITRNYDGTLTYHYNRGAVREDFGEDQIFHLKGFSVDGETGLSPVTQGRESMATAVAAEKSAAATFRNSMRPSLVVTAPNYLSETQRKRYAATFTEEFTGVMNAGKVPLLEGNWKIDQISMKPEDAQLLATRSFSVEQICRWFIVPPPMIGHMDKATAWGTGLEQMNLWFLTYCLRPLLAAFEQELWRAVFTPADRIAGYYAEFNVEGLTRTDAEKRANMFKLLSDAGVLQKNEIRAEYNYGPIPGGDNATVASGSTTLEQLGQPPPEAAPPPPGRQQGPTAPARAAA